MIALRLDIPALRELLKDKDEVELQITQAAVAEICRRATSKYTAEALKVTVEEQVKGLMERTPHSFGYQGYGLISVFKDRVEQEARLQIDRLFQEAIQTAVKAVEERLDQRIRQAVTQMELRIASSIETDINRRINEGVKAKIDAILSGIKESTS